MTWSLFGLVVLGGFVVVALLLRASSRTSSHLMMLVLCLGLSLLTASTLPWLSFHKRMRIGCLFSLHKRSIMA